MIPSPLQIQAVIDAWGLIRDRLKCDNFNHEQIMSNATNSSPDFPNDGSIESLRSRFTEEVEVAGHIIDSLILPKILDEIMVLGGRFTIEDVHIGQQRHDPSRARLREMRVKALGRTPSLARTVMGDLMPIMCERVGSR